MYAPLPLPKFLLWALLAQLSSLLFFALCNHQFLAPGSDYELIVVAENILKGGWLDPEHYLQLEQKFLMDSAKSDSLIWQDLYVLARDGRLYTKYCHLLVFLLVPFLYLFGQAGSFVLSTLILQVLFLSLYVFLKQLLGRSPSVLSGVILIFGSPIIFYGSVLSYDLLAAALVLLSCMLMSKRSILAGFFCGITVFIRPSNVFYGPCFLFLGWKNRKFLEAMFGFFLAMVLFSSYNKLLWGSWISPSHSRLPYYVGGERMLNPFPSTLSLEVFWSGWLEKLFAVPNGFLTFATPLFALLVTPLYWKNFPQKRTVTCIFLTCLLQCALIFSFAGWQYSEFGSRYLLPCYALLLVLVCLLLETIRQNRAPASQAL